MCKRDVSNCTCEVARCAKGTSQIAHRMSHPARIVFSYVQFGTSLSHIMGGFPIHPLRNKKGQSENVLWPGGSMVEPRGIEPLTSWLPAMRSPS